MPCLYKLSSLILALCCCALPAGAQQRSGPDFAIGAAASAWAFPFSRASGGAPFDFRLKQALAPEIQFQFFSRQRLGLSAAAGLLPSRLNTEGLYDIFSHTRHQAEAPATWGPYLLAGVGINLLAPEKQERFLLVCRAGYFFNQIPAVDERYISLQDYRQRQVAYRFSRSGGAVWQPGFLLTTPPTAAGIVFQVSCFAHFSATAQEFSRFEQGDLVDSGRFRAHYDGLTFQFGALYLIQNRKL
jgi:hypothetical protein